MFEFGHVSPNRGKTTTVDPIKDLSVIRDIKETLNVRDRALFSLALNTALRGGDLVSLTWDDLDGQSLSLLEGKTKKRRVMTLNDTVMSDLLAWRRECDSPFIYSGQRGQMTVATWSRLVKSWCEEQGLNGRYGSHTCRKSFVRIQHDHFGTSMATLMEILNHENEKTTRKYMGLLSDDVSKAYSNAL